MKFKGDDTRDNVIEIFTSSEGSSGTKVSLYRSALLSALTIANTATSIGQAQFSSAGAGTNGAGTTTFGLFAADDVRPSPPMHLDYPWVCLSRRSPILRTCVQSPVEVCQAQLRS